MVQDLTPKRSTIDLSLEPEYLLPMLDNLFVWDQSF